MSLKKWVSSLCFVCIVTCTLFSTAYAYEEPSNSPATTQPTYSTNDAGLYEMAWRIKSFTKTASVNGSYRNGPSGYGRATLSINEATTINRYVENKLTGQYTWGAMNISAATGYSFSSGSTHGTSYSITIPAGAHRMIIFRPVMGKYKIVMQLFRMPTSAYGKTTLVKTETAYGYTFDHWDFNWRNI